MLFFQLVLFAGYLYAHLTVRFCSNRTQVVLHCSLLFVVLCLLPIIPSAAWKPAGGENPVARIFALLAITVGGSYFLLASTAPLIQAGDSDKLLQPTEWMLLTRNRDFLRDHPSNALPANSAGRTVRSWTDQYSNLFDLLK